MKISYDPAARFPFGIEFANASVKSLSSEQLESHLREQGLTLAQIVELILVAKSEGIADDKLRSRSVQAFIDSHCFVVAGAMIPFGEFYKRFLDSLPGDDRFWWSHYRVSRALPVKHPSGSATMNMKFIANLAWEPGTPMAALIAVPGNKRQGRARVLKYR